MVLFWLFCFYLLSEEGGFVVLQANRVQLASGGTCINV